MERQSSTILSIDDHRDNLITLQAVIHEIMPGARVLSAEDGQAGIELARAEQPDVVLLDILMPGMDGFQVCRELKRDPQFKSIPVLFLTSLKSERKLRIEALEAGADGFLSKPIDEIELHAALKSMLQLRQYHLSEQNEKTRLASLVQEKTQELKEELDHHRETALQLRETEFQYRLLFENMTQAFALHEIILDENGHPTDHRFLEINPGFEAVTGLNRSSVLGKTVLEVLPGIERSWIDLYGQVALGGPAQHFEDYAAELDKHFEVWVSSPKRGQFAVLFNDITDRKDTEIKLIRSENRFLTFLNSTTDFAYLLDSQHRIVYANDAIFQMLEIKENELRGNLLYSFLPDELAVQARESDSKVLESRSKILCEETLGDRTFECLKFPVELENSEPGIGAFVREITHRKTAEIDLRESEARFRAMIEHSPIAYQALDEHGLYIDVNDEYCNLVGYEREELIGKLCADLWSPETRPYFEENFAAFLRSSIMQGELQFVHKNGDLLEVRVEGRVQRDTKGDFVRTHCVLVDITAQKRLNRDLVIAKEKAEESDRLKSAFLANMSHEVRTPMNAIIGFAELLTETDVSTEDQQQYTQIIKQRSYDLLNIINDILHISLIDAGEVVISEEIVDIPDFLDDLVWTYKQLIPADRRTEITLQCQIDLDAAQSRVFADSGRLRQVLTNLLSNAFKFTASGSVLLGCRCNTNKELLFFVKDTGIGIDASVQEFIFDRFRQADESSARHYGGTGLGLSISRELVSLMGGRIWVDSTLNIGSTFMFTLPFKLAAVEA